MIRKILLSFLILVFISGIATANTTYVETETQTTGINFLYMLVGITVVLFAISLISLYFGDGEVNIITVFTMAIPSTISFKISNLFIDGTLVRTHSFLSSVDTVIIQEEVIRNTALSNLFELLGICFAIGTLLQFYYYIKNSGVQEELL